MTTASADRCAAFEGALRSLPDTKIVLDNHTWRVDSSLLAEKSQCWSDIIDCKDWDDGDKTIVLTNDDPYIFARLIQYLYYAKYQARSDINVKRDTIANLELGGASVLKIITSGRRLYAQENNTEEVIFHPKSDTAFINIEVHLLAEKYRMSTLVEMSGRAFACQSINSCKDLVNAMNGNFGKATPVLRENIARFVGRLFKEVMECKDEAAKTVHEWLWGDRQFSMLVMKSMSAHIDQTKREEDVMMVEPPVKKARK
ncbi:hypothetical protein LTR64_005579 [Lithohypha guttulata]|uniref:uncharacterized protein n=1 Tax=Lithohypha guttulata TaxID=1690604 RepID=UPI002DDF2337|nr:hypothetical protein LTR51_002627 [Lithohypha guttulata]